MALNTDHLNCCLEHEVFRNTIVKGYELTLETSGKLIKNTLNPFLLTPISLFRRSNTDAAYYRQRYPSYHFD